jgi:hypothetical protein
MAREPVETDSCVLKGLGNLSPSVSEWNYSGETIRRPTHYA